MRKLILVLGNGFTIDLLAHLNPKPNIDLVNLFSKGDTVVWPDGSNEQGFLSYKHCPSLWSLGARPYMQASQATDLIEDIITCANMISCSGFDPQNEDLYTNAYYELVAYLKHLFIQYNSLVPDSHLLSASITEWGWFDLIKRAYDNNEYEKIVIITYNYDIFLERVLRLHNLNFSINGIEPDQGKILILKPHGSISFAHEIIGDVSLFSIRKSRDMYEAALSNFSVNYSNLNDNFLVNALVPPAGDSTRMAYKWASEIRERVQEHISQVKQGDKVIISGLSYWHVDRREIDELLIFLSTKEINTYMVNPNPPRALNAVLTCVLPKHIIYMSSDLLKGVC
ncbi:MAG: hypothetical protein BGN88_11150 [Clostridiales bacterium 43-6]|nr:MAG: hypothetical protein BGN88_11150 [Clostridiales bacterium 43-6]